MRKKEALLVIDMLNDFVREGAPLEVPSTRAILPALRTEIEAARSEGRPVVYVCDSHIRNDPEFKRMGWPVHALKGTEGAEVIESLKPQKRDHVISKSTYSGFYKTRLHALLRRMGVNHLLLTGCVTNICVLYTASDAVLRGYEVTVKKSCVAGLSPETDAFSLKQMREVLGVRVV